MVFIGLCFVVVFVFIVLLAFVRAGALADEARAEGLRNMKRERAARESIGWMSDDWEWELSELAEKK